jgi:type IV pilus assembly protein PilM
VAQALRQLWSKVKFSTKNVALGVANQKVVVRQVDLPGMDEAELRKALSLQVQDYIPIPVDQAILDFQSIESFTNESGGPMLRVLLVAAARDTVVAALDAVQAAGLKAVAVDLTSFAIIRALCSVDQIGMETHAEALVDIGARITNIAVHQGGVPRFVRMLLMGGQDVTDAVAERMGVPIDQAEAFKHSTAIPATAAEREASPAARAIEAGAAAFVDEVRGSLDYYLASPGAIPIRRIVVSGGGSLLGNILQRISAATRLPVEAASPLSTMRMGKTGLSDEQLMHIQPLAAVSVGLAMGVAS